MKKFLSTTAIVGCMVATPALADPTVMLGLSINFGGAQSNQVGITGKVLTDNKQDTVIGAAGVTYFPGTGAWGVDAGLGYNFDDTTATLTYDFVNQGAQLAAGWADLEAPEDMLVSS